MATVVLFWDIIQWNKESIIQWNKESKCRFTFSFGQIFLGFTAYKNLHRFFLQLKNITTFMIKSYWIFRKNNVMKYSVFAIFYFNLVSMQIQMPNLAKNNCYLPICAQKSGSLNIEFLFLKRPFSSIYDNNIYYSYFSKSYLTNTVFPRPLAKQTNVDIITATYCYK